MKIEETQEKLMRPPVFKRDKNKEFFSKTLNEETGEIFTGILKHFDEIKNYGFIMMDNGLMEIFYHYEDVIKEKGVNREFLATCRSGNIIKVSFECVEYFGKYNLSRKAIKVRVLEDKQQMLGKYALLE